MKNITTTRAVNLTLKLTSNCQQKCKHCPDSRLYSSSQNELSVNEIKEVVEKLKRKFPSESIRMILTGGEPFEYSQVEKLFDSINTSEFGHVALSTNGISIINEPKWISKLVQFSPDEIMFSTEWGANEYQALRNSDFYPKLEGLITILKDRLPDCVLSANVMVTAGSAPKVLNSLQQHNIPSLFQKVDAVRFISFDASEMASHSGISELKPEEWIEWKKKVRETRYPAVFVSRTNSQSESASSFLWLGPNQEIKTNIAF